MSLSQENGQIKCRVGHFQLPYRNNYLLFKFKIALFEMKIIFESTFPECLNRCEQHVTAFNVVDIWTVVRGEQRLAVLHDKELHISGCI